MRGWRYESRRTCPAAPAAAATPIRWRADFMPKFPAGLQDPRYPFEPPPESCDFLGVNIVTRAVWANGEAGIGMDFDLRLTRGWYAPCRIELEVPHALSHVPAVVHAVVRDK